MLFKVVAGKHRHRDGVTYHKGDIVESESELDKIFVNKFMLVGDGEVVGGAGKKLRLKSIVKAEEAEEEPEPEVLSDPRGTSVKHAEADKAGLSLFKRGGSLFLYDGEETVPLNDEALKKKAMESFIEEYLEQGHVRKSKSRKK